MRGFIIATVAGAALALCAFSIWTVGPVSHAAFAAFLVLAPLTVRLMGERPADAIFAGVCAVLACLLAIIVDGGVGARVPFAVALSITLAMTARFTRNSGERG